MDPSRLDGWVTRYRDAWNSRDTDAVLACFADDLRYRDAETRGDVEGQAAMRRYCDKFFATWDIQYQAIDAHAFAGGAGFAVTYAATVRRTGKDRAVAIHGVDLVFVRGDAITRVESYYDRTPAIPLLTGAR